MRLDARHAVQPKIFALPLLKYRSPLLSFLREATTGAAPVAHATCRALTPLAHSTFDPTTIEQLHTLHTEENLAVMIMVFVFRCRFFDR